MTHPLPPPRTVKLGARRLLAQQMLPCFAVSGIVWLAQLCGSLVQTFAGGSLGYYMLEAAAYDTQTGLFLREGGFVACLRLDSAGILYAFPVDYALLPRFFLVNVLIFLITTPLLFGALEQLWGALHGKKPSISGVFRWYLNLGLSARALSLSTVLTAAEWVLRAVCMAPGLGLLIYMSATGTENNPVLIFLSSALPMAGFLASFYLFSILSPVRYMLVREPERTARQALSEGVRLFAGRRGPYFALRLSFLPWTILSLFTALLLWRTPDIFIFPYMELSNLLFLHLALSGGEDGQPPLPSGTP